jgi:hypothetical protein
MKDLPAPHRSHARGGPLQEGHEPERGRPLSVEGTATLVFPRPSAGIPPP